MMFLIAPFPDHCFLLPFNRLSVVSRFSKLRILTTGKSSKRLEKSPGPKPSPLIKKLVVFRLTMDDWKQACKRYWARLSLEISSLLYPFTHRTSTFNTKHTQV